MLIIKRHKNTFGINPKQQILWCLRYTYYMYKGETTSKDFMLLWCIY